MRGKLQKIAKPLRIVACFSIIFASLVIHREFYNNYKAGNLSFSWLQYRAIVVTVWLVACFGIARLYLKKSIYKITETNGNIFYNSGNCWFTYNLLLSFISEDVRFFFVLNLVYILVINLSLWSITVKVDAQNKLFHCFTIILSFLFLPQLFYMLFVYGLIPGVMLSLLSFCCYLNIEYVEEEGSRSMPYRAVMVAMILPGKVLPTIYRSFTDSTVSDGTPGLMYIAKGLRDDENYKTVGDGTAIML